MTTSIRKTYANVAVIGVVLSLVVGMVYVFAQWAYRKEVADPIFVGILMANDFAIYSILKFFIASLGAKATELDHSLAEERDEVDVDAMIHRMFSAKRGSIMALIFGAIFFAGVFLLGIAWPDHERLRFLLALFLFASNFVTGLAIYSLWRFFRIALRLGAHVRVQLFDRSDPVTQFLMWSSRRVVQATAFISSLAMLSLLFSVFALDFSTILFGIWTIVILSVAYVVPIIPITNRLAALKAGELNRLGLLLQNEYRTILASPTDAGLVAEMQRFDSLAALNKSVSKIRVFPPVGSKSVETALFVTFLTLLPSLTQFILTLFG